MALEQDPARPVTLVHGYEAGGCLAGTRYCRVTPEGHITACPYMEESAGSIRKNGFTHIWKTASIFQALRAPKLEGRCGDCEYAKLCGGCRARPLARSGNLMGEDFLCRYQPGEAAVIDLKPAKGGGIGWSAEAEERLSHVPAFVRRFVRQRAETFAREQGADEVTKQHLEILAQRRFGKGHFGARPPIKMANTKPVEDIGQEDTHD